MVFAWMTKVKVNGRDLRFKIDTGADVRVTPERVYKTTFSNARLQTATRHSLRGPGGHALIRCEWEVYCQPPSQRVAHSKKYLW